MFVSLFKFHLGLLMVTCTDMAILCGNGVEACHAKYGAMSAKISSCHEMVSNIIRLSLYIILLCGSRIWLHFLSAVGNVWFCLYLANSYLVFTPWAYNYMDLAYQMKESYSRCVA